MLTLRGDAYAIVLNIHGEPRRLVVFALELLPNDDKRRGRGHLRSLVDSSHQRLPRAPELVQVLLRQVADRGDVDLDLPQPRVQALKRRRIERPGL